MKQGSSKGKGGHQGLQGRHDAGARGEGRSTCCSQRCDTHAQGGRGATRACRVGTMLRATAVTMRLSCGEKTLSFEVSQSLSLSHVFGSFFLPSLLSICPLLPASQPPGPPTASFAVSPLSPIYLFYSTQSFPLSPGPSCRRAGTAGRPAAPAAA